MKHQLTVFLKTQDCITGRLTRAFKSNDTDIEVLLADTREKVLISLDDVCYFRFHGLPQGIPLDGPASVEEVQTLTGEAFQVAVLTNVEFVKGFIGVLRHGSARESAIFFTDSGVRCRLPGNGKQPVEDVGAGSLGMEETGRRVGDILVEAGLVTRERVESALNSQKGIKRQVGELLILKGLITEQQLLSALATRFGLRFVDLDKIRPSDEALEAIPVGLASRLKVFPISLKEKKLVVATSAPTDITVWDNLRFSTNYATELVVAPGHQIEAAIDRYYRNRVETVDTLLESMKGEAETLTVEEEDDTCLLFEPDSKVISLVNRVLIDAHRRGASDIHFEPGTEGQPLVIRYRIDGECALAHKVAASYQGAVVVRIKIMAVLDIAERRRPQSGKILLRYRQQMLEYRVEITPVAGGREAAVLRLLAASKPLPLEGMSLMPYNLARFAELLKKPHGIILCVGPTGSGKTTTLHSALGHINCDERKIWTAEDPVEITQRGLCQVQVNARIGFTFAEALRSFLRADPDVIMIGEMRDVETAKIAIEASLTGHLVFSTLHTNSAPEAAVRLIEMGMDPFNFSDALQGIVAQRLAKKLCPSCRRRARNKRELYEEVAAAMARIAGTSHPLPGYDEADIMEAAGCEECGGTGYKGRIAIHEVMVGTPGVKAAIRQSREVDELRSTAIEEGMWTLKMDGLMKVLAGETDMEHLLKVCM